ncbi:MAG TPA: ISNCY family transposase [Anaerolinea thermolimosa]|uniref:ISNCY family transposase n=2 Tax=Anaerolinea thermolimosa TaxID=229919 RepID=A0A3D1JHD5_9CHLR|nr:ISNCY family transposase [Anaerolinea thermolimosa]
MGGTRKGMDELLAMSKEEITRLETMQRIKDKRLTQGEAARILGLSVRQIKRLYRAYKGEGAAGLVSRRRGKPSNHRLDGGTRQKALDLLYERYADFGPTLAHEKLSERHQLRLSRESVRKLMIAEGLWKPRRGKKAPVHQMRERRACLGELVQIDGSDHAWFEERGPQCTLLVFIDDATGQLMELWFVPDETFFAYCEATRHYLERYGKPLAFYSDRHGIFRVNQPRPLATTSGLTQFGRAMQELEIQILCASTPQAKGRIERANQTLQDRLVKELRLRGISDMATANAFLPEFREDFNRRFAVAPRSHHNAHRPLLPAENLDLILSHQETRTLSKNLTLQFKHMIYQIQSERPDYALRNARVTVCETPQGEVTILYKNQPLPYSLYQKAIRQADIVDTKSLDRQVKAPPSPAPNHPWRRYGHHLNGKPIEEASPHGTD